MKKLLLMSRSTVLSRSTGGLELDRGRGVSSHKEQGVVMKTPAEASSAFSLHRTPPHMRLHEAPVHSISQALWGGVYICWVEFPFQVLLSSSLSSCVRSLQMFPSFLKSLGRFSASLRETDMVVRGVHERVCT